jgi:hypothetical protein
MSADADNQHDDVQRSADASRQPESGGGLPDSAREQAAARQVEHEDNRPFPSRSEVLGTAAHAIENVVHGIGDAVGHGAQAVSDAAGRIWEEAKGSIENLRDMPRGDRYSRIAQTGILAVQIGLNAAGVSEGPIYPVVRDNANRTTISVEAVRDTPGRGSDSNGGIVTPAGDLDAIQAMRDEDKDKAAASADQLSEERRRPHQEEIRPGNSDKTDKTAQGEHLTRTQEKRQARDLRNRESGMWW